MERDRSHVLVFTEKWRSEENYSKKKKEMEKRVNVVDICLP
jgi:hypothetical protein